MPYYKALPFIYVINNKNLFIILLIDGSPISAKFLGFVHGLVGLTVEILKGKIYKTLYMYANTKAYLSI